MDVCEKLQDFIWFAFHESHLIYKGGEHFSGMDEIQRFKTFLSYIVYNPEVVITDENVKLEIEEALFEYIQNNEDPEEMFSKYQDILAETINKQSPMLHNRGTYIRITNEFWLNRMVNLLSTGDRPTIEPDPRFLGLYSFLLEPKVKPESDTEEESE